MSEGQQLTIVQLVIVYRDPGRPESARFHLGTGIELVAPIYIVLGVCFLALVASDFSSGAVSALASPGDRRPEGGRWRVAQDPGRGAGFALFSAILGGWHRLCSVPPTSPPGALF